MLKFRNPFKRKKPLRLELGKVGLITDTDEAIESGVNDKFNKKIVIYKSVSVYGNNIIWGKKIREDPYTEEEAKSLIKTMKIPIVERKLSGEFVFEQLHDYGSVIN